MTLSTGESAGITHAPADVAGVQNVINGAVAAESSLRIVGRRRWPAIADAIAADTTLSLASLSGIVEYVPGDLTLTARAGTSLRDIARVTAEYRQLLALDPFGEDDGTLGATVATASYGPLAHAFGTPRDNVLGVELVTGSGEIVRGGGRVVKNVAGFDLVRLMIGAWGTLGVLTEITVRLRAMPELDETIVLAVSGGDALAPWLARLQALPLQAWALELVNAPLAQALQLPVPAGSAALVARLAGNEALVRAESETLASLGTAERVAPDVWTRLRAIEPANAIVSRESFRPSLLAARLDAVTRENAAHGSQELVHATVGRGTLRRIRSADRSSGFGFDVGRGEGVTRVLERAPGLAGPYFGDAAVDPVSRRLMRGVKRAFDPHGVLNPLVLDSTLHGESVTVHDTRLAR